MMTKKQKYFMAAMHCFVLSMVFVFLTIVCLINDGKDAAFQYICYGFAAESLGSYFLICWGESK